MSCVDNKIKKDLILDPSIERFVLFPIKSEKIWEKYQDLKNNFWSVEENYNIYTNENTKILNDEEFSMFRSLLYSCMEINDISIAILNDFTHTVQLSEARTLYGFIVMMKYIHLEFYNKIYDDLPFFLSGDEKNQNKNINISISENSRKNFLYDNLLNLENERKTFSEKIIFFLGSEIIFNITLLLYVNLLSNNKKYDGFEIFNEKISKDLKLFINGYISIYKEISKKKKINEFKIKSIFNDIIKCELEFAKKNGFINYLRSNKIDIEEYRQFIEFFLYSSTSNLFYNNENKGNVIISQKLTNIINKMNINDEKIYHKKKEDSYGKTYSVYNSKRFENVAFTLDAEF